MKTIKFIFILFTLLFLANSITGCGAGGGSTSTESVADSPASSYGAAGLAKLAWNASTTPAGTPDPNVAGYKVYYGTSSGNYTNNINVGMATSYTVSGLAPGTYYFTVTAYDASGNESGYSNEAIKRV